MAQIGVITEQNDLGLGFNIVKESEQKKAQEVINKDKKNDPKTDSVKK